MRNRILFLGAVAGLFIALAADSGAATITNVLPVNVTPSSFTILWRTLASTPSIAVFADANGTSNLFGQLAIEAFPLHTGVPDAAAGYERRQTRYAIRQKTQSLGLMMVRVSGCRPNTTYYYQLTSTPEAGAPVVYPASGPLPSVTTEIENTFVIDDQQLIIDVPGLDNMGRILTLSNSFTAHPIAAVVGDGVGTNQVFFNANDLFALGGQGNFAPIGQQDFTARLLAAGSQPEVLAQFSVTFGTNFMTGGSSQFSFGTEFFAATVGSVLLPTGGTTNVPLSINCSVPVSSVDLLLNIAPGHLDSFTLQALAPELDPAAVSVTASGTNWLVHLPALAGSSIFGNKTIARLAFNATAGQHSAFVPLTLMKITALKPGGTAVASLFGASGRVVVLGPEALVEAGIGADQSRGLTLYGKPNSSYAVESASGLAGTGTWSSIGLVIPMMSYVTNITGLDPSPGNVFYRAVEFFAEPPLLRAWQSADGKLQLTIFGVPGKTYLIRSAAALGFPTVWTDVTTVQLTGSFAFVTPPEPIAMFYRVVELVPPGGPTLKAMSSPVNARTLLVTGDTGHEYTVEYSTNLSNVTVWYPFTKITLSGPTGTLNLPNTNAIIFYRLKN